MKCNKIVSAILLVILVCWFPMNFVQASENTKSTSMYMWEVEGINFSDYSSIVDYFKINKIYAYIGTANIADKIGRDEELLFDINQRKKIDTYIVYDENYADQNENLTRIKTLIDEVKEYNSSSSQYKISGIAIDSEFHSLPGYGELGKEKQQQLFASYVSTMTAAHEYANQYGIKYVACIPVWLDKLDKTQLEELIKNGCDYVQLMNYTKSGMITNIKEEIEFAKKYNKPIENIAELQKPGSHGDVTEEISFYNDGIDACNQKFQEIDNEYNYNLLTFCYHYYKPLVEISRDIINDKNKQEDKTQSEENNDNQSNQEKTIQEEKKENKQSEKEISSEAKINQNTANNSNLNTDKTDNTTANKILPSAGIKSKSVFLWLMIVLVISVGRWINNYQFFTK